MRPPAKHHEAGTERRNVFKIIIDRATEGMLLLTPAQLQTVNFSAEKYKLTPPLPQTAKFQLKSTHTAANRIYYISVGPITSLLSTTQCILIQIFSYVNAKEENAEGLNCITLLAVYEWRCSKLSRERVKQLRLQREELNIYTDATTKQFKTQEQRNDYQK